MGPAEIRARIRASLAVKEAFLERVDTLTALCLLAERTLAAGGKLLICGNGGSACDAAHLAAELVGWFLDRERRPLPAIALGFETPALTAIANDKGYEHVFARQVEALGRPGDLLLGISTSGRSPSVVRALEMARARGLATAVLLGADGADCAPLADVAVLAPSRETPRIQECHLLALHILAEWLERRVQPSASS